MYIRIHIRYIYIDEMPKAILNTLLARPPSPSEALSQAKRVSVGRSAVSPAPWGSLGEHGALTIHLNFNGNTT